jgi:hypothetical protein
MRLGYLDQRKRFEATLTFLIERIKRDDIAEAFQPRQADLILTSVTALLDGLHGCLAAYDRFVRDYGFPGAGERYKEEVRESAGVALALVGTVLSDIGEKDYFQKNLSEVNAHRILTYMQQERETQKEEAHQDKEFIKDLRARRT